MTNGLKTKVAIMKVNDGEWKFKLSVTIINYHDCLHEANFQNLVIQGKILSPVQTVIIANSSWQ